MRLLPTHSSLNCQTTLHLLWMIWQAHLIRFFLTQTLRKLYIVHQLFQVLLISLFYSRLNFFFALFLCFLEIRYQECLYYAILCLEIVLIQHTDRVNKNVLFPGFVFLPNDSFLFWRKVESFIVLSHRILRFITWQLLRWNFNTFCDILCSDHPND